MFFSFETLIIITIAININSVRAINQCNTIQDNYCLISDDCSQQILEPKLCLNDLNNCDLILKWNIADDLIEFNLTKLNFKFNEWNGILFSFENKKSDLLIALMPQNRQIRLLNGDIKNGSDIVINDEQDVMSPTIQNKNIKITNNNIEIVFTRLSLSECGNVLIHLLNGKIASNGSILYNESSLPKPIGPFCFNSDKCYTSSQNKQDLLLNDEISADLEISPIRIAAALRSQNDPTSNTASNAETTTMQATSVTLNITVNATDSRQILTTQSTQQTETTFKSTTTSTSTSTTTTSSEITTINSITSSLAADITSTFIISTTTAYLDGCSSALEPIGNSAITFKHNYNNNTGRIEFESIVKQVNQSFKFAIFLTDKKSSSPIFMFYSEIKNLNQQSFPVYQTIQNSTLITSLTLTDQYEADIKFSLPINYTLNNGSIELKNVFYFKIYLNYEAINQTDFLRKVNTSQPTETKPIYLNSCNSIPKTMKQFYLRFVLNDLVWSDEYHNLTSNKSIILAANLSLTLTKAFSSSMHKYNIENFTLLSLEMPIKRRQLRQSSFTGIIAITKFLIPSSSSLSATQTNINDIIATLTTSNTGLKISDSSLSISNPIIEIIPTTTFPYTINNEYPAQLALALSLSLVATIVVLGGGLAGFLYWRKSKFRGPAARSAHTNPFLRVFGDRFSSNRYRSPPAVRLDGLPPNSYTNDEFELNQYENQTFDGAELSKDNQNFTDFTGSREVGIDIGDLTDNEIKTKTQPIISDTNKETTLKLPTAQSNHSSRRSTHNINLEEVREEDEQSQTDNPFYIDNENNMEMTRDDFDKFLDTKFSELLDDKNIQEFFVKNKPIEPDQEFQSEKLSDTSESEDNESELNNIFSKETIEKNLPELFGIFGESNPDKIEENKYDLVKNELDKRYTTNSSRVSAPLGFSSKSNFEPETDSLSTSSVDLNDKESNKVYEQNGDDLSLKSEDIDDYKAIDSSAFKNLRIQSNNQFVINDQSTLKDYINQNKTNDKIENAKNKLDDFLMTELPKPRICLIEVNSSFDGLGIHLCGTKNHMIKNIESNSPADLGGLKPGDKILVINNENVEEASYTTVVNRLKESLLNKTDINLVVMNIIEYNMFKAKNPALENLKNKNEIEIETKSLHKSESLESLENDLKEPRAIYDFGDQNTTKFQMENFVNAEFNPFHDVPNEMFSPFLHYASIPPPPANFQANDEAFFAINNDADPFQLDSSHLPNKDDSNSDLSVNSINSLRNAQFRFSDFSTKNQQLEKNEFDDNFLKTFQTNDVKKAQKVDFTMWNSSTSDNDYSDNGNDLIDGNEIITQVSTPKIRDRF